MGSLDPHRRAHLLAAERRRLRPPAHGAVRVALAYPAPYRTAMASLAFQWVTELTGRHPGTGVERAVAEDGLLGRTLESGAPLSAFDAVAFSVAFEPDAPRVLATLEAAGIPLRAEDRGPGDPLVVVGGPVASIAPLPLAPAVDVFCLGAAERTWPGVLELLHTAPSRDAILDALAERDGYLVPSRHLDRSGRPRLRLRRLERRGPGAVPGDEVPASHVVTPYAEYREMGLVESSRGCPERCRYCWIAHASGAFRPYAADAVMERIAAFAPVTRRIGLVATAVGDHPEIARLLSRAVDRGFQVSLSSLRIPAMVPEVLEPLAASGARTLTIAPETGSDRLRAELNKAVTNDRILEGVRTAFRCGFRALKLYFIVGLPGERDEDLDAIAALVREIHRIGTGAGVTARSGPWLRASVNLLIPKPYTPYHGVGMLDRREAQRRLRRLERALRGVPGFRLDRPSIREAHWQGYLARAGVEAFPLLVELARGTPLGEVMSRHREAITSRLGPWTGGPAPWHLATPLRPGTAADPPGR